MLYSAHCMIFCSPEISHIQRKKKRRTFIMRKCGNCKKRAFSSWSGHDYCLGYEMSATKEDEMREAANCKRYEVTEKPYG